MPRHVRACVFEHACARVPVGVRMGVRTRESQVCGPNMARFLLEFGQARGDFTQGDDNIIGTLRYPFVYAQRNSRFDSGVGERGWQGGSPNPLC